MSWIKEVRADLRQIDTSKKALRKFGVLVGGVLLGLAGVSLISRGPGYPITWVFGLLGCSLASLGLLRPTALKVPQLCWMGLALVLGWVVSRIILVLLFYGVITPIGIFARLTGKKFLNVRFRDGAESYWIERDVKKTMDYEKMF